VIKISPIVLKVLAKAIKEKPLQHYIDKAYDDVISQELRKLYRKHKNEQLKKPNR
jgi:hypothetical protein